MLEQMIQTHFIDRVAVTLGEPPEGRDWARDLAQPFDGRTATAADLERAARSIIETGGKTFPGFGKCHTALKSAFGGAGMSALDAAGRVDGYHGRAAEHIKARGGRGIELQADGDKAPQYRAWAAYFANGSAPFMASQMDQRKAVTVPAEWPWEFDASSPRSYREVQAGVKWSEEAAINFIATKASGMRAAKENWAIALIGFVRREHREPGHSEAEELAQSGKAAVAAAEDVIYRAGQEFVSRYVRQMYQFAVRIEAKNAALCEAIRAWRHPDNARAA